MSLVDPRVTKQARVLVDYSLKVKKGENVVVGGDVASCPLVKEIYRLLILRGANEVKLHLGSYEIEEIFFKNASYDQLKHFPVIDEFEMKHVDCYIRIGSSTNTRGLTSIDAEKISLRAKVMRPITDYRVENTRWVVTRFPTEAQAQEADMSLSEYSDFVFNGINKVDWQKKYKEQENLRKLIDATKEVHILGPGTDLRLGIAGRKAENAYGTHNMPDGEVFTSVIENKAEGFITYTYPALHYGREFHNVALEFKKGKVVKASADKNEKDLNKILDMDKGARFIGELGIGNNYQIKRFTKDTLFDEKIGGSIHLALGNGYKETLSKNKSGLHWDMIKDLRSGGPARNATHSVAGGELWFDDKCVQRSGRWLIKLV